MLCLQKHVLVINIFCGANYFDNDLLGHTSSGGELSMESVNTCCNMAAAGLALGPGVQCGNAAVPWQRRNMYRRTCLTNHSFKLIK